MINRQDALLLLTELQQKGIDVSNEISTLYNSQTIPLETLQKINDNMPLELLSFYEKLRRSYNDHKSKLYINIMKADENVINDPKTVLTTLSAMLNQILQYKVEDQIMFEKAVRADEIVKVISLYLSTHNIDAAYRLLKLIKADIVVSEYISRRRK